ncbi:MAG: hypothetical protein ACOC2T_03955 [Planctomycetota bacterium]
MIKTTFAVVTSIVMLSLTFLTGCRTERERVQADRQPQNTVFDVPEEFDELKVDEDEPVAFALWNQNETQSTFILRIKDGAELSRRFHRKHDLTLVCLAGNAIVNVEGERQFVESPAALTIPRLWSYEIIPHKTTDDFTAMLIYSPTFEGDDVVVMKGE